MVAQYFKRKREFVEIFIVSGSGLGIVVMSTFIKSAIEAIGWRFVDTLTWEFHDYGEGLVSHMTTNHIHSYNLNQNNFQVQ